MAKDQPLAIPNVVADADLHDIHRRGTIDGVRVVVTDKPIRDADIAAVVEQLNEVGGAHNAVMIDSRSPAPTFR